MAALGLVILVAAAITLLVGGLANSGSDHMVQNFSLFGSDLTASSGRLLLYGAIIGAVGMLGLNMLLAGLGRGFKNKVQTRRTLKAEREKAEDLENERTRLQEQLDAERGTQRIDLDAEETTTTTTSRHMR